MEWLSNIMNWGSAASSAAPAATSAASTAGYGLGQPLVTGSIGSAQYAQGASQGTDWKGLLGRAAMNYKPAQQQQEQIGMQHNAPRFGVPRKNPGAQHLSGLLISDTNMAES